MFKKSWILGIVVISFGLGVLLGKLLWGGAGNPGIVEEGRTAIAGIANAQRAASTRVETVQGTLADLGRGIERAQDRTENIEAITHDLAGGIDRSIELVEASGNRLGELVAILGELERRNAETETPGRLE
jgi:hypothetical protein